MAGDTPPKPPSKALVKSKLPSKIPPKSVNTAPKRNSSKVPGTASKIPISASKSTSKVPSKVPISASKLPSAVPPSPTPTPQQKEAEGKKSLAEQVPVNVVPISNSTVSSTVKKDGEQSTASSSSKTKLIRTSMLGQSSSPHSSVSDRSLHFATYDDTLSSVETPRGMPGILDVKTRENLKELHDENNLSVNRDGTNQEPVSPILLQSTQPSSPFLADDTEMGKQKEDVIGNKRIEDHDKQKMNANEQLVKAEGHITQLTEEVIRLREALSKVESPLFVQHVLQLENELKEVREKLAEERTSTRYHKEAHLVALGEVGKLRETMGQFGTQSSLIKRNTELEARIDEMTKEKVEQELEIARLKEEAYALKMQFGNLSFGSEYITVRLAGLCEICREKLNAEAEYRAVRDRLSQLAESKPIGVIPPSLSEPWSPDTVRKLQKQQEEVPSLNSRSHTFTAPSSFSSGISGVSGRQETKQERVMSSPNVLASRTVAEMQGNKVTVSERLHGCGVKRNEWRELLAPDGRTIYYNTITNKSTFEMPTELKNLRK
ncbi:uncharacterized protein TM35_000151250 [Trypanosoma theileri]|uniref:WW domain-containing protein n=1 Tax=Trypanosoma theileri TaxID=67003 RepID=A0A1X0NVF6_9TRYP|nr:uncharacterized protein TM35_000151250 [Trypanosoma theileri]ORC88694.1 hypothetical protein TM35_000151250 [Trypanosoma theileri]